MHAKKIYLYCGPGTSPESIEQTLYTFNKLIPSILVKTIDSHEIISGNWINDAALFIMPGGADKYYCKALNGRGNAVIKNYINAGGAYLGLCAGAYYGAKYVKFAWGTDLQITGERELGFFNGTAEGPTLAAYDYRSKSGARAASLCWSPSKVYISQDNTFTTFFNGGCHFVLDINDTNIKVLAWYDHEDIHKMQPAIVKIKSGEGIVILSGVHVEYSLELLDQKDTYIHLIFDKLKNDDEKRTNALVHILKILNLEFSKN